MISRVTLYTLLAAVLLGLGIRTWSAGQPDVCAPYLAGDLQAPATEVVEAGTRLVEVPCTQWLERQPLRVQVWCLADGVLAAVFLLNAGVDVSHRLSLRRRRRKGG